jgi:hypothetical protein
MCPRVARAGESSAASHQSNIDRMCRKPSGEIDSLYESPGSLEDQPLNFFTRHNAASNGLAL